MLQLFCGRLIRGKENLGTFCICGNNFLINPANLTDMTIWINRTGPRDDSTPT